MKLKKEEDMSMSTRGANPEWRRGLRFLAVGAVNTGVDLALFYAITVLWPPRGEGLIVAIEAAGAWLGANLGGRALHGRITFGIPMKVKPYLAVSLAAVGLQAAMAAAGSAVLGQEGALLGKVLGAAIGAGFAYRGYRRWALAGAPAVPPAPAPSAAARGQKAVALPSGARGQRAPADLFNHRLCRQPFGVDDRSWRDGILDAQEPRI